MLSWSKIVSTETSPTWTLINMPKFNQNEEYYFMSKILFILSWRINLFQAFVELIILLYRPLNSCPAGLHHHAWLQLHFLRSKFFFIKGFFFFSVFIVNSITNNKFITIQNIRPIKNNIVLLDANTNLYKRER